MKRDKYKSFSGAGSSHLADSSLVTFPRFGTKRDVAAMCSMSVRWVDGQLAKGLPVLKVSSRRCRFDLAEVREWLRQRYSGKERAA